ncbi:restriction endonuclease [Robbsia sp. KACC 23696]|uniref:restriction endonuclease n=1 Tax=Robbsia sp. KACC 23696 TaxID=3149231 RepID=UPI00325BB104
MIYRCSACNKTAFETLCPWCAPAPGERTDPAAIKAQQIPLDASFFPEFQYQTKGFVKDLLVKRSEQAQLGELLRAVLQKYARFKMPYFANFLHIEQSLEAEQDTTVSLGARSNGSYTNRELFREVLVRKGFTELEELPHLLDKLLQTTGFNAAYLGFSSEMSRHIAESLEASLKSWISETGTRFRDDLSLFFYFLWERDVRFAELAYSEHAAEHVGSPLLSWRTIQEWSKKCETLHFDILVERMASKLTHFEPMRFVTMYHVDTMDSQAFEKCLTAVFETAGYDVEGSTPGSLRGADLFVNRFGKKILIQARQHAERLGKGAVQDAISAKRVHGCDEAIVVTNAAFTQSAIELANAASVRLIDRTELQAYLDDYNQRIIAQFESKAPDTTDLHVPAANDAELLAG